MGAKNLKLPQRQATFTPGVGTGLEPTLQRRRTRASLRACNWDPLPDAPLVLLDGPYNAPALHWEVRQTPTDMPLLKTPHTQQRLCGFASEAMASWCCWTAPTPRRRCTGRFAQTPCKLDANVPWCC